MILTIFIITREFTTTPHIKIALFSAYLECITPQIHFN